jgi:hypothetical protein
MVVTQTNAVGLVLESAIKVAQTKSLITVAQTKSAIIVAQTNEVLDVESAII